jgi:6-pyruvoyltetrahydropterin/6-carboxytetrahydropterin synthase
MPYVVEISQRVPITQGLPSPVRRSAGLPAVPSVPLLLTAGIAFDDDQLTARGWFADTDAVSAVVRACADRLGSAPWTSLFDFRPTFELVARRVFAELAASIPQLAFVALRDETFGTTTRFTPAP